MMYSTRRQSCWRFNKYNSLFLIVVVLVVVVVLWWISLALHFLLQDEIEMESIGHQQNSNSNLRSLPLQSSLLDQHIISLNLLNTHQTIRISILAKECPKAYQFIKWLTKNQQTKCQACTLYRGEPVPAYWGSADYPDRWDNGGRWGPPYALVQGGFVNSQIKQVEMDQHRPPIKRGMVAWAGGQQGVGIHFFIALADHPEWGNEHTVWGYVLEEDLHLMDALVKERPLKVLEHNVPVITNFVDPIPFKIKTM